MDLEAVRILEELEEESRDTASMHEKDEFGYLQSDVHRKETAVNSLLHASSSHPPQTITAVPIGQYLRMRRICSTDESFEFQAQELRCRFRDRGYSQRTLRKAYNRAKQTPRIELLYPEKKQKEDCKQAYYTII
ncbi:hypothetical protein GDO81_001440 [Engystomops pustulosus]|uniref:Helix-turn-helix domain-containing protein n=1 Tax=Engystomops pustulosus TaxID=76066 RepID=A0AAV7DEJ9_ENGPU|nr:hypothetical protein GDO81_001440 [Engystomops pustulosus]